MKIKLIPLDMRDYFYPELESQDFKIVNFNLSQFTGLTYKDIGWQINILPGKIYCLYVEESKDELARTNSPSPLRTGSPT